MVEHLEKLDKAVCDLENELGIPGFHWSKYKWRIRYKFIQGLLKESFMVKVMIVQNPFSEDGFETAVRQMLTEKKIKKLVIDGKKPLRYVLRLKKVLREHHVSAEKIRMGNDMAFPGLRVADAYAGLVRCSFNEKDNIKAQELYQLAKNKITALAGGPVSS